MTPSQGLAVAPIGNKHEIIFPQGEFWSDEPPLESNLHLRQILILIQSLEWAWQDRDDYFATGNLTIYYSPNQKKSEDFRGPDFFVVLGTTRNQNRKSWVIWQEGGKYPHVIIEILSESTADIDKKEKKQIYQDIFRTPEYFWFDPESLEMQGFNLTGGLYEPLKPNDKGWLWSQQLGLYLGIHQRQLRYFTSDKSLVPTPEEAAMQERQRAEQERQRAEHERQRAEHERQRAEALAEQLKRLGVKPNE
jgi:Uma2 family endonuclease